MTRENCDLQLSKAIAFGKDIERQTTDALKRIDADSRYELQCLDCNCNDCKFMVRDTDKPKQHKEMNLKWQTEAFDRYKAKTIADAQKVVDEATDEQQRRSGEGMLREANKLKFQFAGDTAPLSYGRCRRFWKEVSFLPNTCQIHTQKCFQHRKSEDHE